MPLCLMESCIELSPISDQFGFICNKFDSIKKDFQRRMKLQRWEEAGFLHFYGDTEVGLHKCKETCLRFRICMGIDVYSGVHSRTLSRGSRTMLQTLHLAAMLQLKVDNLHWGSMDVSSSPYTFLFVYAYLCVRVYVCVCCVCVCVCGSVLVWCSTHEKSHTKLAFLAKSMFLMPPALSKAFKEEKIQTHLEKYRVFSPLGTVAHKVCLWDGFDSIKFN